MPRKRRVAKARLDVEVPVRIYRLSDGTSSLFDDDPVFPTREAAEAAWPEYRRATWATSRLFEVPKAATIFDGITATGVKAVLWGWNAVRPLKLEPVLKAIEEDRNAVARFRGEQPKTAETIADFLHAWLACLAEAERTALDLAMGPGGGRHPSHLSTTRSYAGGRGGGFA